MVKLRVAAICCLNCEGEKLDVNAVAAAPKDAPKVLWVRDWSAFCLNCVTGGKAFADDLKGLHAASAVFVGALQALAPALMAWVEGLTQPDAQATRFAQIKLLLWCAVGPITIALPWYLHRYLHRVADGSKRAAAAEE